MADVFVPREVFLTKGVGRHKEQLASFEEALRDAQIARFNLVHVSSIFPPQCKVIPVSQGVPKLKSGQILYCVLSRNQTDEHRRLISSSIGLAIPKDRDQYGYISEVHSFGQTEEQTADYAEDLAAQMLSTVLGIEYASETSYDERKEIWKLSGKIVRTTNSTQAAIGVQGEWTTVVSAAVFVS
jgi:arginine decarboxylase